MFNSAFNSSNSEILTVINDLAVDKGITKESIVTFIEEAFAKIALDYYGDRMDVSAKMNFNNGEIVFFAKKNIIENPESHDTEIDLETALTIEPDAVIGDSIFIPLPAIEIKRIPANSVKNLILLRIKSAEKELEYNEFKKYENEITTGIIKKVTPTSMIINIGNRGEAIIFKDQMLKTDSYRVGDKIKSYIKNVEPSDIDCQIICSRTDNRFLASLMADVIGEIQDGMIEIKNISREPGSKAKVAVYSTDMRLDPVGACIGPKGSRIKQVMNELKGERIDIINWDKDLVQLARNAIVPAKSLFGSFIEEMNAVEIVVPDDEFKIAIGRSGQNVRLASQLIGYNITIILESTKKTESIKRFEIASRNMTDILEVDESVGKFLLSSNMITPADVINFGVEKLVKTGIFTEEVATELIDRAQIYVTKITKERQSKINQLNIDKDILNVLNIDLETAIKLAENNVKNIEDIADLSTDDFLDIVGETFDKRDAMKIIMSARNIVFNQNEESEGE